VAAAAMVALLSGPAGAAEATDEIKQNCAAEPGDYAMQQYCYDRHVESLVELKGLIGSEPYPKHVEEISARCLAEAPPRHYLAPLHQTGMSCRSAVGRPCPDRFAEHAVGSIVLVL
jgi:hypothetical protein